MTESAKAAKQVIMVRKNLDVRKGKMVAQGAVGPGWTEDVDAITGTLALL